MKLKSPNFKLSDDDDKIFIIELKDALLLLTLIYFLFIFIIAFFNVPFDNLTFMLYFDLLVCILLFFNLIQIYHESKESFWLL